MNFIGLDLTDPYANRPRPIDVAVVRSDGTCAFTTIPAFSPSLRVQDWLSRVTEGARSGDVLIIDGPLGLARPGSSMRECERLLGAPGKTPDRLPMPGTMPFAGYVRGSVETAQALMHAGWVPMTHETPLTAATMLEAYPGGTWTLLAGAKLPHKTRPEGIRARTQLLVAHGLVFERSPRTHDELDAALCAWLGWQAHHLPERVATVGLQSQQQDGQLREGVILQVSQASRSPLRPSDASAVEEHALSGQLPRVTRHERPSGTRRMAAGVPLPAGVDADWVYFATPARAERWETAELAFDPGFIHRTAHNARGARIANVGHLRPGEVILLAYSEGQRNCQVLGAFQIRSPLHPVPEVPALEMVEDQELPARRKPWIQ